MHSLHPYLSPVISPSIHPVPMWPVPPTCSADAVAADVDDIIHTADDPVVAVFITPAAVAFGRKKGE